MEMIRNNRHNMRYARACRLYSDPKQHHRLLSTKLSLLSQIFLKDGLVLSTKLFILFRKISTLVEKYFVTCV